MAHLGHIRTKYVFFVFTGKNIFRFVSISNNLSVVVFPSKRKYLVVFARGRKSMALFPQVKLHLFFPQAGETIFVLTVFGKTNPHFHLLVTKYT